MNLCSSLPGAARYLPHHLQARPQSGESFSSGETVLERRRSDGSAHDESAMKLVPASLEGLPDLAAFAISITMDPSQLEPKRLRKGAVRHCMHIAMAETSEVAHGC